MTPLCICTAKRSASTCPLRATRRHCKCSMRFWADAVAGACCPPRWTRRCVALWREGGACGKKFYRHAPCGRFRAPTCKGRKYDPRVHRPREAAGLPNDAGRPRSLADRAIPGKDRRDGRGHHGDVQGGGGTQDRRGDPRRGGKVERRGVSRRPRRQTAPAWQVRLKGAGQERVGQEDTGRGGSMRDILGGSEPLCIASYDEGFFAPMRLRGGGVSRPVVDMIQERFGITCGSPRDVWALCSGQDAG